MQRKTDSHSPADWLFFARSDLEGIRSLAAAEVGHEMARSKLAEVLEKLMKAELIRTGWGLEKTHDLQRLAKELRARNTDLFGTIRPLVDEFAEVYFTNRYPGFDVEDADWPALRTALREVEALAAVIEGRLKPVP